jgi:deoxyribonuclease V
LISADSVFRRDIFSVIACVDVSYHNNEAVAACVLFRSWTDESSAYEIVERIGQIEEYQPGEFYRRELPCLLAVLHKVREPLEAVIVDGFVWLGDENSPGLGAWLYDHLRRITAVIGVAKSRFAGAVLAVPVLRGHSRRPLYVTAAGMDVLEAARHIQEMHGKFRIPTLLKQADQLSRRER